MEQWEYPSKLTARLIGNTLVLTGYLIGKTVNAESIRQVIREGTILESQTCGCQIEVAFVDDLHASVTAYGNRILEDNSELDTWNIIAEVRSA